MACATIAVRACCRIWVRERLAVSIAKSASWMREREALRFSALVLRLLMVLSKRDCRAPNLARCEEITARDESTTESERVAESTVDTSKPEAGCNSLAAATSVKKLTAAVPDAEVAPLVVAMPKLLLESKVIAPVTWARPPPAATVNPATKSTPPAGLGTRPATNDPADVLLRKPMSAPVSLVRVMPVPAVLMRAVTPVCDDLSLNAEIAEARSSAVDRPVPMLKATVTGVLNGLLDTTLSE